nr:hypothetical protein [Mycobacterium sp. MS1601]
MKSSLATMFVTAICVVATACSQTSEPAPVTVTVAPSPSSAAATAPAPPPVPTPGTRNTPPAPGPPEVPGADGSTGNNLSPQYCAQNEDPGCPAGSYIGPDAIPSPDGDGTYVPCEGTICTNPNHGAGPEAAPDAGGDIPEPGQDMQSP